jgi:copper oxidase (laccase) domain-containing protein
MSSAIRHIHYKPELRELSVWFGPEGRRYKYADVPPEVFTAFAEAPSRGKFFNSQIRGHYPAALVDPSEKRMRRWQAIRSA